MAEINGREITPVDFLEAVYLNPNLPLATRLRAAIEAAPYRHAKLSAHAVGHYDGKSFAEQLERAIAIAINSPDVEWPGRTTSDFSRIEAFCQRECEKVLMGGGWKSLSLIE